MNYEKWIDLYNRYEKYDYPNNTQTTYEIISKAHAEFDEVSKEYYSQFSKEELVDSLLYFYTEARSLADDSAEEYFRSFLSLLHYYSDRMHIGRLLRLKILIENAKNLAYIKEER